MACTIGYENCTRRGNSIGTAWCLLVSNCKTSNLCKTHSFCTASGLFAFCLSRVSFGIGCGFCNLFACYTSDICRRCISSFANSEARGIRRRFFIGRPAASWPRHFNHYDSPISCMARCFFHDRSVMDRHCNARLIFQNCSAFVWPVGSQPANGYRFLYTSAFAEWNFEPNCNTCFVGSY